MIDSLWQFLPNPSTCEFAFQYKDYYHRKDPAGNPFKFASVEALKYYYEAHKPLAIHIKQNDFLIFDIDKDDTILCEMHPNETRMVCDVCWVKEIRPQLILLIEFLSDLMDFKEIHVFDSGRRGVHVWVKKREGEVWDKVARVNLYNQLEKRKIKIDKAPLIDLSHLIKVPYLPHAVTGCLALPIQNINAYLPSLRIKK
jgi:DNA primase catalytic subunit